jgi:hypothetical protein
MQTDPDIEKGNRATRPRDRIIFVVLIIVLVGMLAMLPFSEKVSTSLAVGIVVIAALLAFSPWLGEIQSFKAGAQGIEFTRQIEETKRVVDKFVFLMMPDPVYRNLVKLASKNFGKFNMTDGFRQQIRSLRDTGFINVKGGVSQLPGNGPELSDYVDVTKLGQEFIDHREKITNIR